MRIIPHGLRLRKQYIAYGLLAAGALLAATALSMFLRPPLAAPAPPADSAGLQATAPSAAKPTKKAVQAYTVAPDLPKFISAPSIGIDKARIIQLGVAKTGAIAVPTNLFDAGWYNGSAKPGQPGAQFVYGHVSSWQANGLFYNLKKLKPGDTVTITRGDDHVFMYKVAGSKTYPHDNVDMGAVLAPVDSSKPGLNLMTCAGKVIKGTNEFSERLVVFLSQAGS